MSETLMEAGDVHARPELLVVADTVARDKGIEREEVLEAMEMAIQKAGRSKYGHEHDIRAHIDRKSGEIMLARYIEVLEDGAERERIVAVFEEKYGSNPILNWIRGDNPRIMRLDPPQASAP